ncbi:protein-L-isoaspartate(D-aspartate) O-methyltransferase [Amycolatopsis roodepoortensis]|nr:protein-L-isoaspartate(D-aspartate) O-methyltransferase [Amycolatopsis roodepoortensis]
MNDMVKPVEGNNEADSSERVAHLRTKMVDDLIAEGTIVSAQVEAAMRKVPRERFAPGVDLEEVYQLYNGVVTKRDESGNSVSSVSAPQVQAHMLQQAEITEGMRVLEIGSGGYNAALIAELVGPAGRVTTVDIDQDITDRASRFLGETGYSQVNVVFSDAEAGVTEQAPYDRILVTVNTWDVPPAWVEQLAPTGLLVVPLQVRGLSRTIAFEKADECLVSRSARLFGFVSMRGAGAHQSKLLVMRGGEVTLRLDDDFPVDPTELEGVLDTPRVEVWSGASIGRFEPWAGTQMWLATALSGFCRVILDKKLDSGLISPPGSHSAAMAVVDGGNLAYVTTRSSTVNESAVEFGVHAFGPDAERLAEDVAEQLRIWERDHRNGPGPQFRVYPAGTADDLMPAGRVVDKKHSRITISWPHAANAAAGRSALQENTK